MASEKKTVVLESSDGDRFEVEEAVARQSEVIKLVLGEGSPRSAIPVPNVTSVTLAIEKHAEKRVPVDEEDADLKAWDAEFVKIDLPALCDLTKGADFLNIASLVDLTCETLDKRQEGGRDHKDLQHRELSTSLLSKKTIGGGFYSFRM